MRKMNHELHSGDDALQTSKKTRAFIPDEGKHTSERTKKNPRIYPRPRVPVLCNIAGSPYFVTRQKI